MFINNSICQFVAGKDDVSQSNNFGAAERRRYNHEAQKAPVQRSWAIGYKPLMSYTNQNGKI